MCTRPKRGGEDNTRAMHARPPVHERGKFAFWWASNFIESNYFERACWLCTPKNVAPRNFDSASGCMVCRKTPPTLGYFSC